MKKLINISKYKTSVAKMLFGSITNTLALIFAILAAGRAIIIDLTNVPLYSCLSFCFLGAYYLSIFFDKSLKYGKIYRFKYLFIAASYFALGVAVIFAPWAPVVYHVIPIVFLTLSVINRSLVIINNLKKIRVIVLNALILIIAFFLLIILIVPGDEVSQLGPSYLYGVSLLFIVITSFTSIMFLVFSRFKLKTLGNVIRKTYAIEILYGLLTLIFSFSALFTMIEPQMEKFGDALWYCFAIITTIGFGDINATTVIGRVLSVILGIYGIVVVALITSIIVNLYNETSSKDSEPTENKEVEDGTKKEEKKDEGFSSRFEE